MHATPFDPTGCRVFVAGHRGMVGSAILRRLRTEPVTPITADRRELDLTRQAEVETWMNDHRPDVVVLAAARVGGILANAENPVAFLEENLLIQTNTIRAAVAAGVRKLLFLGSSCIYPKHAAQPIREDALLTGPLEPTNRAYALAKIAGVLLCEAYREERGADLITAMPTNLYGPGDNFDLHSSHVLPALMRKMHEAARSDAGHVVVWGSGEPRREFLHVDDLADACMYILRHYSAPEPINLGTGQDITILELARLLAEITGFRGEIRFDRSKPDGTPRKLLDTSRLDALGWHPSRTLRQGIEETYRWYVDQAGEKRDTPTEPVPA